MNNKKDNKNNENYEKIRAWVLPFVRGHYDKDFDSIANIDFTGRLNIHYPEVGIVILDDDLEYFPDFIQFGHVEGSFTVVCKKLKSLNGCPNSINDSFTVNNTAIQSLLGGPKAVKGNYDCRKNPRLVSLLGSPKRIYSFDCSDNPQLVNLNSDLRRVEYFSCSKTGIKDFNGIEGVWIGSNITCEGCKDLGSFEGIDLSDTRPMSTKTTNGIHGRIRITANGCYNLWKWIVKSNYNYKVIQKVADSIAINDIKNNCPPIVKKGIEHAIKQHWLK